MKCSFECRMCGKRRGQRHSAKCTVRRYRQSVRVEDCHEAVHPEDGRLSDLANDAARNRTEVTP